jgi:dCMP deaminase
MVGAVVVARDDRRKISLGYNGFPPNIADDHRLENRAKKYSLTIHAERNALDNATFDVIGGTIYCTSHPCRDCAKSIASRRIARVVCPPLPPIEAGRWTEELPEAQEILWEAGIQVTFIPAG